MTLYAYAACRLGGGAELITESELHSSVSFAKLTISVSSSYGDGDTSQSCYDN